MMVDKELAQRALDAPMGDNDAGAKTVREYLGLLLWKVWDENEGFDGKRPFGNSSREYEVYEALADSGIVDLPKDEDGDRDWWDSGKTDEADELVRAAIRELTGLYEHPGTLGEDEADDDSF